MTSTLIAAFLGGDAAYSDPPNDTVPAEAIPANTLPASAWPSWNG